MFIYKCLMCEKDTISPKIEVDKLILGATVTLYCDHCPSFDFRVVANDLTADVPEDISWRDGALSKLREQSNKNE